MSSDYADLKLPHLWCFEDPNFLFADETDKNKWKRNESNCAPERCPSSPRSKGTEAHNRPVAQSLPFLRIGPQHAQWDTNPTWVQISTLIPMEDKTPVKKTKEHTTPTAKRSRDLPRMSELRPSQTSRPKKKKVGPLLMLHPVPK